jgi:6-phospho-beta-glucosidase
MSSKSDCKVVVIGGGSSYTPEIVEGLLARAEALSLREVWLVDIPEGQEKLEVVGSLARRMVARAGVPFEVKLTLDRREALPGADYVVTQIRVGGIAARIKDERVPLKHGVIGQETTGPGGFAKALRTVPVMLAICRDMEELCPADQLHESEWDRDGGGNATQPHEGRRAVQQRDRHGKLDREGV